MDGIKRRAYIRAGAFPAANFDAALAKFETEGHPAYTLDCGDDVMVDMPEELTRILLEYT